MYAIETDEVYEDFYEDRNVFDFSDYPKHSRFYDPVNKKWLVREIKKSKDVNKNVIESIRHKEYVNVLFSRGLIRCNMKKIQSKLHRIRIYDVWKI